MKKTRRIAVFDFDGTLTTRDTLLEFIRFAFGRRRFLVGFLLHTPWIILMKIGLYPNWKAKQRVFSWFFRGMNYDEFANLGSKFADRIDEFANRDTISLLQKHIESSDDIYVISASIEEWVRPYCQRLGVKAVLGTKAEVINGTLSGRFASRNCYGKEKVNRLLEAEPDRSSYYLYVYGNSHSDKYLLDFAD